MPDLEKHKRRLGTLLTIMGWIYLVGAALLFLLALITTGNIAQPDALSKLIPAAVTGTLILGFFVAFGLFHILTGRAFRKNAPWARIALWILAIVNLGNVPLGTAFGAYAIWILTQTREDIKNVS